MPCDEGVVFVNGAFDDVNDAGRGAVGVQHIGDLVEVRSGLSQFCEAVLERVLDLGGGGQKRTQSFVVDGGPTVAGKGNVQQRSPEEGARRLSGGFNQFLDLGVLFVAETDGPALSSLSVFASATSVLAFVAHAAAPVASCVF